MSYLYFRVPIAKIPMDPVSLHGPRDAMLRLMKHIGRDEFDTPVLDIFDCSCNYLYICR